MYNRSAHVTFAWKEVEKGFVMLGPGQIQRLTNLNEFWDFLRLTSLRAVIQVFML